MSYDLYMLSPVAGEEPMATLERLEEQHDEAAAPDPDAAARNRRIADALLAARPEYEEFQIDLEAIARADGVTVEQASASQRFIELTDGDGLQITLDDDQASISFPYWESLDAAVLVREIDRAARIIGAETGWQLYDPQLDRFLDPERDAAEFRKAFGVGVRQVQRIVDEQDVNASGSGRPSRWRRLFGRGDGA